MIEVEIRWDSTGNEPCSATERRVLNRALNEKQEPVLKRHDVYRVYEDPYHPGNETGKVNTEGVGHSGRTSDNRQGAFVEVPK